MQEGIKYVISADVKGAVAALNQVNLSFEDLSSDAKDALERINTAIEKNADIAIQETAKIGKGLVTLQDRFQKFGGLSPFQQFIPSGEVNKIIKTTESVNKLADATKKLPGSTNQATFALTNFGRVVQDAPFGIIGIANNIDPLIQSFTALKASTGSSALAFKALASSLIGPAGIAIAVSTITSLLVVYTQKKQQETSALKSSKEELKSYLDIQREVASSYSKEVTQVELLVRILGDETAKRKDKEAALRSLSKINPEYFAGLRIENGLIDGLTEAYRKYVERIDKVIQAKSIEKQIESINDKLLTQSKNSEVVNVFNKALVKTLKDQKKVGDDIGKTNELISKLTEKNKKTGQDELILLLQKNILLNKLAEITKQIGIDSKGGGDVDNGKVIKGNNDLLKEQIPIIERIGLAEETKFQRDIKALEEKIRLQGEYNRMAKDAVQNAKEKIPQPGTQGINVQGMNFGGSFEAAEKPLDNIVKKAIDLQNIIDGGINGGIDTFFNALANNQDPFKALALSVKRLVVELAAAVVKMLVIKTLANLIAPGVGGKAAAAGLNAGILRGAVLGR